MVYLGVGLVVTAGVIGFSRWIIGRWSLVWVVFAVFLAVGVVGACWGVTEDVRDTYVKKNIYNLEESKVSFVIDPGLDEVLMRADWNGFLGIESLRVYGSEDKLEGLLREYERSQNVSEEVRVKIGRWLKIAREVETWKESQNEH